MGKTEQKSVFSILEIINKEHLPSYITMGGRGRGRGTGLSFNAEALGFGRGDALPSAMMAPPPTFPPLTSQPVKLVEDSEQEYILAVWKELRNAFRGSQYFLGRKGDPLPQLDLRWDRLPAELKPGGLKKKAKKSVKPNLVKKSKVDIEKSWTSLENWRTKREMTVKTKRMLRRKILRMKIKRVKQGVVKMNLMRKWTELPIMLPTTLIMGKDLGMMGKMIIWMKGEFTDGILFKLLKYNSWF